MLKCHTHCTPGPDGNENTYNTNVVSNKVSSIAYGVCIVHVFNDNDNNAVTNVRLGKCVLSYTIFYLIDIV